MIDYTVESIIFLHNFMGHKTFFFEQWCGSLQNQYNTISDSHYFNVSNLAITFKIVCIVYYSVMLCVLKIFNLFCVIYAGHCEIVSHILYKLLFFVVLFIILRLYYLNYHRIFFFLDKQVMCIRLTRVVSNKRRFKYWEMKFANFKIIVEKSATVMNSDKIWCEILNQFLFLILKAYA